jgi:hypothetical protein
MDHVEHSRKVETNSLKFLVISIWFLCGVRGSFQNDTWWHLATGRFIWTHKTFPLSDTFSWVTSPNTYWPNHEWLSELCMFLLYSLGGATLMHTVCGVLFSLTAYLILRAAHSNLSVTSLVMLLLLPWLATGAAIRPHVVSMACIAGLLVLLKERRHVLVPPLFLLWAQMHGGVCIGGALLIIWTVSCVLFDRRAAYSAILSTVLSGVAVLANPLGLDLFHHPLRSTAVSRTLPLIEWGSPFSLPLLGEYYACVVIFLGFGGAISLFREKVPDKKIQIFVALALLPLTCIHARTVSLLLPVLILGITNILSSVSRLRAIQVRLPQHLTTLLVVLSVGSAALSIVELQSSPTENPISPAGAAIIKNTPERFFNTYDSGGYLIWFVPEQKVFIDSRQDPYPQKLLQEAIMVQQTGEYQQFVDNFGIRSAVVERHFPLHGALTRDGWNIQYRSPMFDLLVAP